MAGCTFKNLNNLNLCYNRIGNLGVTYLAKAYWPKLRSFYVEECKATTDALRLIQRASWPKLETVSFNYDNEGFIYAASLKGFTKQYFPYPVMSYGRLCTSA